MPVPGSVTQVAEFFVDAATGELVRFGDADADAHELLDMMARLAPASAGSNEVEGAEGVDWGWVIRQRGEQAARELAEVLRVNWGDAAADECMAEIDRIVNAVALENSAASLGEALEALHTAITATREVVNLPEDMDGDDERAALTTLLAAAEKVRSSWTSSERRRADGLVRRTAYDNEGAGILERHAQYVECGMGNTRQ